MFLTFRSARQGDVKRGRFLQISGIVTAHLGSLHLLCGPRPQDLEPLKHGVSMGPPATLTNLSAVVHHVGMLLVRPLAVPGAGTTSHDPPFVLQYGLLSHATTPRRTLFVGVTLPRSHESFPMAAQRSAQEAMALAAPDDEDEDEDENEDEAVFQLWSGGAMPAVTEFQSQEGTTHAYHFFLGLQPPASGEKEAQADGHEQVSETAFVWRTHGQVRAAAGPRRRHQAIKEDGRHVLTMINKARRLLEDALRHGACVPCLSNLKA
jgi:hypothetical protein